MPHRAPKVRSDLEYFEQELEGDDVVLVRDPIRSTYFRFNPLQGAMLRALDETHDSIAVAPIPETGLGEALNDRLRRGAAHSRENEL